MHKGYSQNNEEQIIADYFGSYTGRYLDCGANDGKTLSNTYALYLRGWRGVNVEPSQEAFTRLCNNQPECENINAAIGSQAGAMTLHESGEHLGKGDVSLLSTLMPAELARWKNEQFTPVQVNVITPAGLPEGPYDLITMDIEGMELEVLPLLDLTRTRLVVVEWNSKNKDRFDALLQGFTLIHSNAENLIYAKSKTQ